VSIERRGEVARGILGVILEDATCPISQLSPSPASGRRASGKAPALFRADAERGQGLDHARGDRAALRGASRRLRPPGAVLAEFLSLSPNNKIPAILDPDGPGGRPLGLFESGAILLYLAEKTGRFIPADAAGRYEAIQWLMLQMGGVGPMFGQVGFFHKFAGKDFEDKRPRDRFLAEARRLLGVLDARLAGRAWILGDDFSIADIATFPWVRNLVGFYGAGELVGIDGFGEVTRVLAAFVERPAVSRGLQVPAAA
jgi:GST-like protein